MLLTRTFITAQSCRKYIHICSKTFCKMSDKTIDGGRKSSDDNIELDRQKQQQHHDISASNGSNRNHAQQQDHANSNKNNEEPTTFDEGQEFDWKSIDANEVDLNHFRIRSIGDLTHLTEVEVLSLKDNLTTDIDSKSSSSSLTRFKWTKEKSHVALNLVKHGCKPKLISVAVGCSLRTAQKFVETVTPKGQGESFKNYEIRRRGRKSKDVNQRLDAIREVLSKDSSKTQVEIAADLKVSNTTVCRDLKRIGDSWKGDKKNNSLEESQLSDSSSSRKKSKKNGRSYKGRKLPSTNDSNNYYHHHNQMAVPQHNVKYLTQDEAINLDKELFDEYAFSVDQLMDLAGLSVATAVARSYPPDRFDRPVICCGPGNNGGDGLVCARHLKLFGYSPIVICLKPGRVQLYQNLLTQCRKFNITIYDQVPSQPLESLGNLIIDSVFGFSFKPPNRDPNFARLLNLMHHSSNQMPLVSVDIPSGWNVESGDSNIVNDQVNLDESLRIPALKPDCLVSLTAPKLCARYFKGRYHYLGGRFCPPSIQEKYQLNLPSYPGTDVVVLLE